MSSSGPDVFVICKNCGSEVSPYITECPYCGNRLRKRAPKLDREGRVATRRRRARSPSPSLPRLRPGEIPGIRAEQRPYATIALVLAGLVGCLLYRTSLVSLDHVGLFGKPGSHWWRVVTAAFTYNNTGYAFAALLAIALYGTLLERRHGPLVLALFAIGGVGGIAAAAVVYPNPVALGGNGAALALLCAWVIPDLLDLRRGVEIEGDLIGTLAIGVVVALMPLVAPDASWVAAGVGVVTGLVLGSVLARAGRRW